MNVSGSDNSPLRCLSDLIEDSVMRQIIATDFSILLLFEYGCQMLMPLMNHLINAENHGNHWLEIGIHINNNFSKRIIINFLIISNRK